ncbi:zinc finger protein 62-like [Gigantopelta aegis]|uniref:zinc finger protein 62-like n=1 Tax=Gigantopelta aegis TaxID=1735272 RepID=UPI001B889DA4|nr:zinc finger protein 62-like [Gigantopelta aegis]
MPARHRKCKWSLRSIKIVKIYKYSVYRKHSQRTTLNLGLTLHRLGYFTCDKCKKSFGQKASLLVHRRRHSNAKPYKCVKCDKRFITQAGLVIHKTSHEVRQVKTEQKNVVSRFLRGQRSHKSRRVLVITHDSAGRESSTELFGKNTTKSNKICPARKDSSNNKFAHTHVKNKKTEMVKDSNSPSKNSKADTKQNTPKRRWLKKQLKDTTKTESSLQISCDDDVDDEDSTDGLSVVNNQSKVMSHTVDLEKRMVTRSLGKRKPPSTNNRRGRKHKVVKSRTKTIVNNSKKEDASAVEDEFSDSQEDEVKKEGKVKKARLKRVSKNQADSAKTSRIYQCDVCSKMCYDSSQLRSHRRLHTGEKPFVCNICNKSFRMNACLNVHMRVHTGEKPYHCSTCSKDFRYQNTFNKHLATHQIDVEKQVKCKICDRLFMTRESLWDHKQKLRKCDICAQLFCSFSALNIHKHKNHVDSFSVSAADGKYCQFCTKTFNSNYTYFVHMQKHARKGMPIKFPCPICSESFDTYDALRSHRKSHSVKRDKCVTCPWSHCGKKLTSQTRLDSHLKRHGDTQYLCHRCGMNFTDCVFYLKHRRACYQRITKYACPICSKILSGHSSLQKHLLSHKGEKPCQCEICGARFNNSSHLKRHKRIHVRKGEMPPFDDATARGSQQIESIFCYPDETHSQDFAEYTVEIGNEQVVAYFIDKETEQVELKTEILCATENVAKALE